MIAVLLLTMLAAALVVLVVTVEATRTGRLELGGGGAADHVPDGFYSSESLIPGAVLDGAGWVIAAAIVWIVVAALLVARAKVQHGKDLSA